MTIDKRSLLKMIDDNFSNISYPNKDDFYKAIADREYEKYFFTDKKKKWKEITKDELIKYYDFIYFLDFNGIVYYLPAYMSLIVKHEEVADHYSTECFFLTITDLDIGKLSMGQRRAISNFLVYCRDVIHPIFELDEVLMEKAISHMGNK